MMKWNPRGRTAKILGHLLRVLAYGFVGALLMFLALGVVYLNDKPDLKIWHTVKLDEEFTASSDVSSYADYLALEERLFSQLDELIYDRVAPEDKGVLNRYNRGSQSDPKLWSPNWNRSYELVPDEPTAGVLLLHGLTDSPYSLRALGERLHTEGLHVLGLRVPGHGTAPSALTRTTWQDMNAAVILAMRYLSGKIGDRPLFVLGYSNGGALALHYALLAAEDPSLPSLRGIVLVSPEIGVTSMAALAIWQARIGRVLGLKKLAWESVHPEYDPFKFASFPINAGRLVYELTTVNREKIVRLAAKGGLGNFPPVLAFQSAVDATVSAPALVKDLFMHLPANRHELVVFDINRDRAIIPFLKQDPKSLAGVIIDDPGRTFLFSVLTNASLDDERIVIRRWKPGQSVPEESGTPFRWPESVYSLSHVALPFPPDDPIYGGDEAGESPGIQIGEAVMRGEKGTITIPAQDLLRLRWNPFFPHLEERIIEYLEREGGLRHSPANN